jgi:hypothetical protein
MPRYVREVERQEGREPGSLATPRGYIAASQFQHWPEDQLPVVVVVSPGFARPPRTAGDGRVRAYFSIGAGVIVSAARREAARENGQLYAAAMRALVMQNESLDGFATGVELLDEDYSDFPFISTRTLMSARVVFVVAVDDVVTVGLGTGGPWGPPIDPPNPVDPPEWPRVREALVDVRSVPELTLADPEE